VGRKKVYALITFIPCLFITVTTFAAGVMNIKLYLSQDMLLNAGLSMVVIVMVAVIVVENVRVWLRLLKTDVPVGMNLERADRNYCPDVEKEMPEDLPLA
jgi:carbon starvation protein